MGKTKTAFVTGATEDISGRDKYEQKKKAKEAKKLAEEKVHISGLKGGERIKIVGTEPLQVEEPITTEETAKIVSSKKVKVRGQKYLSAKAKVDRNKLYSLKDAIKLLKETSITKFDGTVELHLKVKKEGLSTNVTLPHSTGSSKKIEVADDKTVKKLQDGIVDFDILLSTPDMMPKLVPFAKILGPKGLMPNPKNGTLIKNVKDADKFSLNTLRLKTQKDAPVIHTVVGKVSQKSEELEENLKTVIEAVSTKQIEKAVISATMSPGIKLSI